MKKIYPLFLVALLILQGPFSYSQERDRDDPFEFLSENVDTSLLEFIKTYKCKSQKGEELSDLFQAIKDRAQSNNANCFKLRDFYKDSLGTMTLLLNTYHGDSDFLDSIYKKQERNTVYILSDMDFTNKVYGFRINKTKLLLKSGNYYKYRITAREKIKINMGGFTGTTVTINWEENQKSRFYSLSGFGLSDNFYSAGTNASFTGGPGIGLSFTSGKVKSIDRNFGLMMTQILNEAP